MASNMNRDDSSKTRNSGPAAGRDTVRSTGGREESLHPGEEGHLEVAEEQLEVGKRQIETGGVRIRRTVEEKPVEEKVNLREEHVNVERRPADRQLNSADPNAFRETTVEVRETAEQPVVAKTARVIEEVIVGKDVNQRTETVRDKVRRSDVEVEKLPSGQTAAGGTSAGNSFESHDSDFRQNFKSAFKPNEYTYEQVQPAYRYGYDLSCSREYGSGDWSNMERDARTHWEQRNPGTWDKFKNSIKYGWERGKAKMS